MTEAGPMSGDGPLILAVEDEPRNAALLEAILSRAGFRLHVADELGEAREWLAEETPSLVLLDRHLPDGDGLSLIPEIKGSARLHEVPILLVSASVLPHDVEAAMAAGCDGFLAKPVRVKPLVDEVRRLLVDEVDEVDAKLAD
jgi:two-component system cell cycle response regulator DivK